MGQVIIETSVYYQFPFLLYLRLIASLIVLSGYELTSACDITNTYCNSCGPAIAFKKINFKGSVKEQEYCEEAISGFCIFIKYETLRPIIHEYIYIYSGAPLNAYPA